MMGRLVKMTVSGVLVLGLAVAGCGGSSSTSSSTQAQNASQPSSNQQSSTGSGTTTGTQTSSSAPSGQTSTTSGVKEHVPTNKLIVSSPAFTEGGAIPVQYTCDGADTSPPLHWAKVPSGTVELILFISNLEGTAPGGGELISWAVAGLKPTLKGLSAGTLPAGAVVGRNSFGQTHYTLCPPKGSPIQHYIVVIYAMQHPIGAQPGFAANVLSRTASHKAEYSGLTGFSYKRQ
jgi:phosphatidylethanolamine-binding protein (PEBP) family uncharacterized protein